MSRHVSDAVIRRLPGYYRHLRELEAAGVIQISSAELGERMGLTPSQIRQDINCFGGFGRQGYGYNVANLRQNMAKILGIDKKHTMVLIGAGNIGAAVTQYHGFARDGFTTLAAFDTDPEKIGRSFSSVPVLPMSELETYLAEHPVDIATLAVPVSVAQDVADRVIAAGVKAIWNFSPTDLVHDRDVIVVNVHLSDTLEILSYRMAHRDDE